MIEHGTDHLPEVKLYDYADQQSRGLVEGYYGLSLQCAGEERPHALHDAHENEHLHVWSQV